MAESDRRRGNIFCQHDPRGTPWPAREQENGAERHRTCSYSSPNCFRPPRLWWRLGRSLPTQPIFCESVNTRWGNLAAPPSCSPACRRDAESTAGGERRRTGVKKPIRHSLLGGVVTPPHSGSCHGTHTPGMGPLQAENPAGTGPRVTAVDSRSAIRTEIWSVSEL
jgi:hypothetical protein